MARGCSMPPAISVVRISPLSLATSIWSRLLSIQYSFPVIQSTARPSGVARPCCTTTSIPVTPETANKNTNYIAMLHWYCIQRAAVVSFSSYSFHCSGKKQGRQLKFVRKALPYQEGCFLQCSIKHGKGFSHNIYNPAAYNSPHMLGLLCVSQKGAIGMGKRRYRGLHWET